MADFILVGIGAALVIYGLWVLSPAIACVAAGTVSLAIAYGRYRSTQSGTIEPNQESSIAK
jgi:uncharacterized protein involved in exopolysaccharide biosynthesis